MIEILFEFGADVVLVRIDGASVLFGNTSFGTQLASIDGLKLNHAGVIKEHPDLDDREDWKEEAVKRFKEKIKSLKNERERARYVIADLKPHGYFAKKIKQSGCRPRGNLDG